MINAKNEDTEGRLTMANARIINVVATECAPENDAKFNKWYDEVHIPMFLKYKGLKKVTRYRNIDDKTRFLAIYEYDTKEDLNNLPNSPEFKAAIAEMQQTWKDNPIKITLATNYEPIKAWEK
jgi:antibiotic biosynthesis monooxygenase (ABM) superfamily enzyme